MTRDVHCCVTVFYQPLENDNIANQIQGFTIDYGKFTLITVICLSCWGGDCASPDKSKLEWKLHFLEWKSRSLGVKNLRYPNVHFSVLSPFFLLSFDLSLSCKLQLIDLITVFAAFLVGRQTILVSFFSRERRYRKETNGWKNKSHRNWTLQIHLSRFVRKIVCPVSKNAIEEWFFCTFI